MNLLQKSNKMRIGFHLLIVLLSLLWLHFAEDTFNNSSFRFDITLFIFVALSFAWPLHATYTWRWWKVSDRIFIISWSITICFVFLLSFATFKIGSGKWQYETDEENLHHMTLLLKRADIEFYGLPRGPFGRFTTIRYSDFNHKNDVRIAGLKLPRDFADFAAKVDPHYKDASPKLLLLLFFRWQFPDYIPLIRVNRYQFVKFVEDNRVYKRGVSPVRPWIRGLVNTYGGGLGRRFRIYGNLIEHLFGPGVDRRDLMNHPYFLKTGFQRIP